MIPCDICHKEGHAWFDCSKRSTMPAGWKPERLKSRPQHVQEKRAEMDGDVMVTAPAAVPDPKPPKARPTPTRKQLERIANKRVVVKRSTAARKDVRALDVSVPRSREATATLSGSIPDAETANDVATQAGTQAPPVEPIIGKRRGRPQTITDMKAYKADKERQRRAKLKAAKDAK